MNIRSVCTMMARLAVACVLVLAMVVAVAAAPADTDALRTKYPDYAAALAALGDEQTKTAIESLTRLAKSDDPQLAADASFYLGRALVIEERFEDALPVLEKVCADMASPPAHMAEALYLQGTCQARLLKRTEAVVTWERFLKDHADAPERMRVDAARRVAELKKVKDGSIGDIHHRMDYAGRRLALSDSGKPTQDRQEEIVAMLTKLIGENEKEEQQDEESSEEEGEEGEEGEQDEQEGEQQPGSQKGQRPGKKPGSKPGNKSGGQTPGGSRQKSGDDVAGRAHQSTDRGRFGDIQKSEREERIYNAVKKDYPPQFEKLIEQYSKSLQDEDE